MSFCRRAQIWIAGSLYLLDEHRCKFGYNTAWMLRKQVNLQGFRTLRHSLERIQSNEFLPVPGCMNAEVCIINTHDVLRGRSGRDRNERSFDERATTKADARAHGKTSGTTTIPKRWNLHSLALSQACTSSCVPGPTPE